MEVRQCRTHHFSLRKIHHEFGIMSDYNGGWCYLSKSIHSPDSFFANEESVLEKSCPYQVAIPIVLSNFAQKIFVVNFIYPKSNGAIFPTHGLAL